eukprot:466365-Prymnesium_polylepis.1
MRAGRTGRAKRRDCEFIRLPGARARQSGRVGVHPTGTWEARGAAQRRYDTTVQLAPASAFRGPQGRWHAAGRRAGQSRHKRCIGSF